MSAKEHYRATSIILLDLPPEIWLLIFRFATWSTDMFDPQLLVSEGYDTSYREQSREFKRSLVTKKYLVRVCKAWYSLAYPFLFEYIFLGKGRVLAPLREGMLRSERAVESEALAHAIGWWTKRLDVHMRDRTDDPKLIMEILADILKRLPNLRILTFAIIGHGYVTSYNSHYLPKHILQATNACRNTLRLVNWYGGLIPSSIGPSWASFLENHPRLEAINAPVALTYLGNSHIVLNSLKSVYVYYYADASALCSENELWNINLPNIHHAICDITSTSPGFECAQLDNFLTKIGPKLTSIQINFLRFPDAHLHFPFQNIVLHCQNLARLDIVLFQGWEMPKMLVFPKKVHTLGIRVSAYQLRRRSVDTFFRGVENFLHCTDLPILKTIFFMDQRNVRSLRAHPRALSSSIVRVLRLGVDVVDHEGRPLI